MFECPQCGSEHETENGLKIHWGRSDDHEGTIAGTEVECDVCGTTYRKKPYLAEESDRHFCSDECKSEGYKDRVDLECDHCGKSFERRQSHYNEDGPNYCSQQCNGEATQDREMVKCTNCGAEHERRRWQIENYDDHFCSVECRTEYMRGENDPKWRGGSWVLKTLRRRAGDFRWRDRLDHIDQDPPLECEMCGATEEDFEDDLLDVHHIVPVMAGGVNRSELLMVLCRSCHRKADLFTAARLEHTLAEIIEEAA